MWASNNKLASGSCFEHGRCCSSQFFSYLARTESRMQSYSSRQAPPLSAGIKQSARDAVDSEPESRWSPTSNFVSNRFGYRRFRSSSCRRRHRCITAWSLLHLFARSRQKVTILLRVLQAVRLRHAFIINSHGRVCALQ